MANLNECGLSSTNFNAAIPAELQKDIHKLVGEKVGELMELNKTEMELMEFRILASLTISEEKIDSISQQLNNSKSKDWGSALKKAKGDIKRALKYYDTF